VSFPASAFALEMPGEINGPTYQRGLEGFVIEVIRSVEREMQRQPAHMVYELLSLSLARRLPGVAVDDEAIRDAAARIAVGVPAL
jgi:hypothetical protein